MTNERELLAEMLRIKRRAEINVSPRSREELEQAYGQVWTTQELSKEFEVLGFAAPLAVVVRHSDDQIGTVEFQHEPRFFFNWAADPD